MVQIGVHSGPYENIRVSREDMQTWTSTRIHGETYKAWSVHGDGDVNWFVAWVRTFYLIQVLEFGTLQRC